MIDIGLIEDKLLSPTLLPPFPCTPSQAGGVGLNPTTPAPPGAQL